MPHIPCRREAKLCILRIRLSRQLPVAAGGNISRRWYMHSGREPKRFLET